jgi:hypothetical protein
MQMQTSTTMMLDTPLRQLYQRQVDCLIAKDVDKLVDKNYADNAVLISSNITVRGKPALKEHFHNYLNMVTIKEVKSTDVFMETEDAFLFEATVETDHGIVKVYDAFVLHNGRITYHFTGVK